MENKDLNKILIVHLSQMRDYLDKLIQRGEKQEMQVKLNYGCLGWFVRMIGFYKDPTGKDPINPPPFVVRTADLIGIKVIVDNMLTDISS